jgi:hypothetical protein
MFRQTAVRCAMTDDAEVEFFGAHIKVKSAKLAALLNSAVTDDVVVVGKRALDLVSAEQRDEEMNYVIGGVEARPDPRPAADEPDDSLDRVFARECSPPVEH